jgi:hypothetical protein
VYFGPRLPHASASVVVTFSISSPGEVGKEFTKSLTINSHQMQDTKNMKTKTFNDYREKMSFAEYQAIYNAGFAEGVLSERKFVIAELKKSNPFLKTQTHEEAVALLIKNAKSS